MAELLNEVSHSVTPRGYTAGLAGANFGVFLALLTPVMISMAFKVEHLSELGQAATELGLVLGVGALFALVANPLFGRLSDRTTSRFGMRRPWIVGGAAAGFLALVAIGATTSIWVVLIAWCIAQTAFNSVLAAANATIPDRVPASGRGKVSGLVGITGPLGILAGTLLVNLFASDLPRFAVPAALGLGLAILFALVLSDRVLAEKPPTRLGVKEFFGSFVFDPRRHPDFGWTWLTKFLVMFSQAGIATFLPYYLQDKFGLDEAATTRTILLAGVASMAMMLISSPLAGIISDRVGKRKPFVTIAGLMMVVGLVILAFAPSIPTIIAGQAVIGLGAGAFFSVDLALATQVLPNPNDTAKDLGVLNIANALPQSIAPALAPAIIALGNATPLGGYPTWYLFGALVALAGALLVYRIRSVS